MPTPKTSHIIEWNLERGFGFLAGESEGERIFLHIKELVGGARPPRAGDQISYVVGSDPRGRPQAVQATNKRPSYPLSTANWITFLLMLILPIAALFRFSLITGGIWVGYFATIASLTAYLLYKQDKKMAEKGQWRISETRLHVLELIGGWPGAFMAQHRLRHKCTKGTYQFFFWVIVLGYQIASIDVLRNGEVSHTAWTLLRSLVAFSLFRNDPGMMS
jgi:uncharacterized membrane protein YsdA (DUF1294 family)/cold shock CspA family protein